MPIRFALLALLFCALIYLLLTATDEEAGSIIDGELALSQDFDYYMTGVDRTHFGADGEPEYRIRAERFTHYPEPDHILVEEPDVVVYRTGENPWQISADGGRIENDPVRQENRVEFSDNVIVRHTDPQGREIIIYTEFLTVYPDSRFLETDREVTIQGEGLIQRSSGMTADLNNERITLLSNVRGQYE